jgi:hypothetical protein
MPVACYKKTSLMRMLERQHSGQDIREIVVDAFNRHGSYVGAADELGVDEETLRKNWMPAMGIAVRTIAEVNQAS